MLDLASHSIIGITLSQDEKEAIFASRPASQPGGKMTMFRMVRDTPTGSFGAASPIPHLSTITDVERPFLSHDGKELFYAANRKLRRAVRRGHGEPFGPPEDLAGVSGLDVARGFC